LAAADAKILARGLKMIEILGQSANGMTAVELADSIGMHKTSIYRYLKTLLQMGYVQSDRDGHYSLGTMILELGSQLLRRMPLREISHPFLVELSAETGKTVHLCVLDGQDAIYIDKVESHGTLPMMSRIGSRAPTYCTGVGKALLSELPTDQLLSLLRETTLEERTPQTITDPIRLQEEIRLTCARGYAIDDEEHELGIKCYAAPVRGYGGDVVGAISITGMKRSFEDTKEAHALRDILLHKARAISCALGHTNVLSLTMPDPVFATVSRLLEEDACEPPGIQDSDQMSTRFGEGEPLTVGVAEGRLREMGFELPPVPKPIAEYLPAKTVGDLVYVSGQGPTLCGESTDVGQVGGTVPQARGYEAARMCTLNALAAVKSVVGSLDRVAEVVHVRVFINSDPTFHDQPDVADGASELLVAVFGERGKHTRAALGTSNLPGNIPVEVELLVRIYPSP